MFSDRWGFRASPSGKPISGAHCACLDRPDMGGKDRPRIRKDGGLRH